MAILTTASGVEFTPAVGWFAVQSLNGQSKMFRKTSSGAGFAFVGIVETGLGRDVYQAADGAVWKFEAPEGVSVEAAQ